MAIVCLVGERLRSDPTLFGRAVTALGSVPLRLVSQAASRRNITFVLRDSDAAEVMSPGPMRRNHFRTHDLQRVHPALQVQFGGSSKLGAGERAGRGPRSPDSDPTRGSNLGGGSKARPDEQKSNTPLETSMPSLAKTASTRSVNVLLLLVDCVDRETGREQQRHRIGPDRMRLAQ